MGSKRLARALLGAPLGKRLRGDYYPTPPEAVIQLLERERFEGSIWEPACGIGEISSVLEEHGYEVYSSDLFSRGYEHGQTGVDFLMTRRSVGNVLTNPPFRMALPFVKHALSCVHAKGKVAMLLKITFLEGVQRFEFFKKHPPTQIYIFSRKLPWRHSVTGRVTWAMLPTAWFIWRKGYRGEPRLRCICDDGRPVRRMRPKKKARNTGKDKAGKMSLSPSVPLKQRQREGAVYSASVKRMRTAAVLTKAYEELLESPKRPTQVKVAEQSHISLRTVKKYWSLIKQ